MHSSIHDLIGGGRVVRRCWVNIQCRGILLIWIIVGQGPIALAVGVGGVVCTFFSHIYHIFFLSPFLCGTARYRLKYCLIGPLSLKQPTDQSPHPFLKQFAGLSGGAMVLGKPPVPGRATRLI